MSKALAEHQASTAVLGGFRSGYGQARLAFERVAGRSELSQRLVSSPLKLLCPRVAGPVAWVVSSHYGGGMVAGDRLDMELELGPQAQALISTQAPGKVFGGAAGVTQAVRAHAGPGATLAWLPDPLVCFAGAIFRQEATVELAAGASLLWCETLGCGRSLRGERWAFERFDSRLRVRRAGKLILNEGLRLHQDTAGLARRFGRYEVVASAFLTGPAFAAGAQALLKSLAQPPQAGAAVVEGAGAWGPDGAVLRLAAVSAEALQGALQRHLGFVSGWLGQDPWKGRLL